MEQVKRATDGRNSFTKALKDVEKVFAEDKYENALIVSVGSTLIPKDISYYHSQQRLLTENNANGFIPGEAATAVLLSKPTGEENEVIISGVGITKESATLFNEEELLRGKGLSTAIMEASKQAAVPIYETQFRVGSMSGEEYFFNEATLAQQKTLTQKIPKHPLWHPADSLGEVGAAIGGAMVIQAYYAMINGYAPGDNAICHISNDDELRGAFIMQYTNKNRDVLYGTQDLEGLYFSNIIKAQLKHDAPFAWHLKNQAMHSPLFNKESLHRLEERLESYLDCFILSQKANDSLLDTLNLSDWGAVYVMASVALVCEEEEAFSKAVEAVCDKQQAKELTDALSTYENTQVKEKLKTLIVHTNPWVRVASIETLISLNIQPDDALMQQLLKDEEKTVKVSTLTLIAKQKLSNYSKEIAAYLKHEDETIKYAASYAGCMLKLPQAYQSLQTFCFSQNPHLREALALLYCVVPEEKVPEVYTHIASQNLSARIKAYNMAMAGYTEAIPLLISNMYTLEDAVYSGEAFSFITGVDLEDADLIRIENLSEEEETQLREASKTDVWTQDYEEDLPFPDVELVKQWWREHHQDYKKGTRYLAGKPLNKENLESIKENGTQAQRDVAGVVLGLRYGDTDG